MPDASPVTNLVSIIVPTFNRAALLPRALRSCVQQTYPNLELIVVDDGSTDNTPEVVTSFQREDPRIRYVRQPNQKLPAALNAGFRASRGEFFTWISDDNLFHPEAVAIMAGALQKRSDLGLVYCGYDIVDGEGNLLQKVRPPGPESIFTHNCVQACFMYRRKVYEAIGDYDPAWLYVEDYDYWLRVQQQFKLAHLPEVQPFSLVIHGGSLTSQLGAPRQKFLIAKVQIHHASPWSSKLRILSAAPAQIAEAYAAQGERGRAALGCLLYVLFKPWQGYRWRHAQEILRRPSQRCLGEPAERPMLG
jgi:glycosyltransferase involved in cell wall biosynthesis